MVSGDTIDGPNGTPWKTRQSQGRLLMLCPKCNNWMPRDAAHKHWQRKHAKAEAKSESCKRKEPTQEQEKTKKNSKKARKKEKRAKKNSKKARKADRNEGPPMLRDGSHRTGANAVLVNWTAPVQEQPHMGVQTTPSPIKGPAGRGKGALVPAWMVRSAMAATP